MNNKIISVAATNSIDFVQHVFNLYRNKTLFAINRPGTSTNNFKSLIVNNEITPNDDKGWLSSTHELVYSNEPAQVVFTSGTEGKPKAILLSHKNLADVISRLNTIMAIDSSIKEYIGIPVTYSFGLGRCRAVAAAGGAFYIPPAGFNPVEIRQMLERQEINAISAVPSLWRILLDSPEFIGNLGREVKWIEIGSQYMAEDEKTKMKELFPEAKIIQHYGLTEASRSTFLDISATEGELLESVGYATGGVSVKLSERGNICIKGDHVALGRLDDEGHLISLTDKNGWLETKDLGNIKQGCLWYSGRSDDQINIGGIKLSPEQIEQEISRQFHCSNQIAIAGVSNRLRGMKLLLAYLPEISNKILEIEEYAKKYLENFGIQPGNTFLLFEIEQFPLTDTGKIQRKQLSEMVTTKTLSPSNDRLISQHVKLSPDEESIANLWREVLGDHPIKPSDGFIDIGGDSLTTLHVIMKMEKKGYTNSTIQAMLQGYPLSSIASSITKGSLNTEQISRNLPKETVLNWSLNALRGLMVCVVLLGHWGPGLWGRLFGTYGEKVDAFLNPLYRMGTPGFAIIFGTGVGFYFINNEETIMHSNIGKRIKSIFLLVFFAWFLLSGVRLLRSALDGNNITGLLIGQSSYNILCYYLLAILSIPIWRWLFGKIHIPVMNLAIGMVFLFWILNWVAIQLVPANQFDSFFELPRLMLIAKYGYFRVGTAVFLGIALGSWLRFHDQADDVYKKIFLAGLILFFSALLITFDFMPWQQLQKIGKVPLSMIFLYLGMVCLLLGTIIWLISNKKKLSLFFEIPLNILIILGVLALPIFASHGIVIPLKDILLQVGVTSTIAIMLPLGLFLTGSLFFGAKIYNMYFCKRRE